MKTYELYGINRGVNEYDRKILVKANNEAEAIKKTAKLAKSKIGYVYEDVKEVNTEISGEIWVAPPVRLKINHSAEYVGD